MKMNHDGEARLQEFHERVAVQETELRVAFEELEDATRRAVGLRHRFESHALLLTAGAFLMGAWLGGRRA